MCKFSLEKHHWLKYDFIVNLNLIKLGLLHLKNLNWINIYGGGKWQKSIPVDFLYDFCGIRIICLKMNVSDWEIVVWSRYVETHTHTKSC